MSDAPPNKSRLDQASLPIVTFIGYHHAGRGKIMRVSTGLIGVAVLAGVPFFSVSAQFIPPGGYSGGGGARPYVAAVRDRDAPILTWVPKARVSPLFKVDRNYKRDDARGSVAVVGAFDVAETKTRKLVTAWASGYLPVTLMFTDGQCYSLAADYLGSALTNGRLRRVACDDRPSAKGEVTPPPPSGSSLRFIGSSWNYGAWADDRTKTTLIAAPDHRNFRPLVHAQMSTSAIMALAGPDYPGGNITLVGRIKGRLTVVTLSVMY